MMAASQYSLINKSDKFRFEKEHSLMEVLDIFSWLPAKEMSLEQLEKFLRNILTGLIKENILFQLKHHAILERIFLIAGQS